MLRGFAARVLAASLLLWSAAALAVNYPIGNTPTLIITAGDMSQATVTSAAIPILGLDSFNIQCIWTGTPNGTFTVSLSNDAATFTDMAISPAITATGAAGNFVVDVVQTAGAYFQLKYTKSSSTGTLNCKAFGKKV